MVDVSGHGRVSADHYFTHDVERVGALEGIGTLTARSRLLCCVVRCGLCAGSLWVQEEQDTHHA